MQQGYRAIVAGVFVGILGVGIWAAIAAGSGEEFGAIALIVGVAVGGTMALASGKPSSGLAVSAVIITMISIVAGKTVAVEMLLRQQVDEQNWIGKYNTEEYVISRIAYNIVLKRRDMREKTLWPAGANIDNPTRKSDFPADIWSEAQGSWEKMGSPEREGFKRDSIQITRHNNVKNRDDMRNDLFAAHIGSIDLVFIVLSVAGAFSIAAFSPARRKTPPLRRR